MANATIGYILHSGKNSKAGYYFRAGFRDILPNALFRKRLQREPEECRKLHGKAYANDRVDYYGHFSEPYFNLTNR